MGRTTDVLGASHGPSKATERIVKVKGERISCRGEQNDHPKVFYTVPETGFVVCMYCDIKFMRDTGDELD